MAGDLLLSSPCDGSSDPSSPVVAGSVENESREETGKQIEGTLQLQESVQFKPRSTVHYLNKSLDWDIDFFTSEGVLNNEELANLNSTFKKDEANFHEDSKMSVEKNSTCSDDAWSLEKLEVQLFENSHEKTQKILQDGKTASKLESPIKKQIPPTGSALPLGSSRNIEPSPQTKKSSIVPRRHSAIYNHGHTSSGASRVTVAKDDGEITSSKTVPRPARIPRRAPLPATPARPGCASGNTQIRISTAKDKSGKVVIHKSVVDSKKGVGIPSSASLKSSQSSKLNLVRNSSSTAQHTAREKTRMKSNCGATIDHSSSEVITNNSSSGSVANKVPSSGSITKGSSRGTRIINRSANNNIARSTSSIKLSLSASPSSSCDSIASLSSSSTFCTTKSMESDESSSSSPSLEGVDDERERAHSPVRKSCPTSQDHKDNSYDVHVSKSSSGCRIACTQSGGNHTIQSTKNSSVANRSKPSGIRVPNTIPEEKSLNQSKIVNPP